MNLRGFWRFSLVELRLLVREPMTLLFTAAFPISLYLLFGEVFGAGTLRGRDSADAFGAHAAAFVAVIITSVGFIGIPMKLAEYRASGVLRRYRAANVPRSAVLGAQLTGAAVVAVLTAGIMAAIALFRFSASAPANVPALVAGVLLTILASWALGCLLGAVLPSGRSAQYAGMGLFFAGLFLGGAGFPTEMLPAGLRLAGTLTPTGQAVVILSDAWMGQPWDPSAWLVLGSSFLGCLMLTVRLFRWD